MKKLLVCFPQFPQSSLLFRSPKFAPRVVIPKHTYPYARARVFSRLLGLKKFCLIARDLNYQVVTLFAFNDWMIFIASVMAVTLVRDYVRDEGNWILDKSSAGVRVNAHARIMLSCSSC